jgi:DNA-3-methyladenine glycosylase
LTEPEYAPAALDYYLRDARLVARSLIGASLVHRPRGGEARVARIVETEAYHGPTDLACHARVGLTERTRALLGPPARAYVFLVYGMHECFNVVCLREGEGHAVLVRAGEPVAGIATGARCDGPGRLAKAMGITRADNGRELLGGELFVVPRPRRERVAIGVSARVGVAYAGEFAEKPWRFFDRKSRHVSRPPASAVGLGAKASR